MAEGFDQEEIDRALAQSLQDLENANAPVARDTQSLAFFSDSAIPRANDSDERSGGGRNRLSSKTVFQPSSGSAFAPVRAPAMSTSGQDTRGGNAQRGDSRSPAARTSALPEGGLNSRAGNIFSMALGRRPAIAPPQPPAAPSMPFFPGNMMMPNVIGGVVCAVCRGLIVGRVCRALDNAFHPECFRCTGCHQPINTEFSMRGDPLCPYHPQCAEELFAERCTLCGDILRGQVTGRFGSSVCYY
jgi:LIM domain